MAAPAEAASSRNTSIAGQNCRKLHGVKVGAAEHATTTVCRGRGGYSVALIEDDLRITLSVGRTIRAALRQPAARQGFGPINAVAATLEWRSLSPHSKPYALIQRWTFAPAEGERASLLVVTRLPPGEVCHVAYVDAQANAEPNVLAREAADTLARGFRCGRDTVRILGARGRATELAKP